LTVVGLKSEFRRGHTPDFAYSGTELDALREGINYYRWLIRRMTPWVGRNVVEVGAGIGTFAKYLLAIDGVESLVALEPGKNTFPALRQALESDKRAQPVQAYINQMPALDADTIVAVNVMEHVEDDLAFLHDAHRITSAGANLLLYVPALPSIYGTLDSALDHYRRYTKKSLRSVIESAGWHMREVSYANLPGVLAWFVAGRIMKKTSLTTGDVGTYDRWAIPLISRIESLWSPPIGQSLFAVASKTPR
jgi:SAM-dependent methyltransferase